MNLTLRSPTIDEEPKDLPLRIVMLLLRAD